MAIDTTVFEKEFTLARLDKLAKSTKDLISTLEEVKKYYEDSATEESPFERVDYAEALLASALAIRVFLAEETETGALGSVYPFEVRVEWLDPDIGATFDIDSTEDDFRMNNAEDVLDIFDQLVENTVRVVGTGTDNDEDDHSVTSYGANLAGIFHLNVNPLSGGVRSTQSGLTVGGLRLVAVQGA